GTVLAARAQDSRLRFGALDLPIPPEVPHEEGGWVTMLVRPEQIHLSAEQLSTPDAGGAMPVDGDSPHPPHHSSLITNHSLVAARTGADVIGAAGTVLGGDEHADGVERLRAALERRRQDQAFPRAEVKIRTGAPVQQIAVEQQESFYELLVRAAAERATARPG